MTKVRATQNIFDVALNTYGTVDQTVKIADENGLELDEEPQPGLELTWELFQGQARVQQFTVENEWTYNNDAVNAHSSILANDLGDVLSPELDIIFIYK